MSQTGEFKKYFFCLWTTINLEPAVVAEQFRVYDQILVDCHSKIQVWIPLRVMFVR